MPTFEGPRPSGTPGGHTWPDGTAYGWGPARPVTNDRGARVPEISPHDE
jgi:hypothetical protein